MRAIGSSVVTLWNSCHGCATTSADLGGNGMFPPVDVGSWEQSDTMAITIIRQSSARQKSHHWWSRPRPFRFHSTAFVAPSTHAQQFGAELKIHPVRARTAPISPPTLRKWWIQRESEFSKIHWSLTKLVVRLLTDIRGLCFAVSYARFIWVFCFCFVRTKNWALDTRNTAYGIPNQWSKTKVITKSSLRESLSVNADSNPCKVTKTHKNRKFQVMRFRGTREMFSSKQTPICCWKTNQSKRKRTLVKPGRLESESRLELLFRSFVKQAKWRSHTSSFVTHWFLIGQVLKKDMFLPGTLCVISPAWAQIWRTLFELPKHGKSKDGRIPILRRWTGRAPVMKRVHHIGTLLVTSILVLIPYTNLILIVESEIEIPVILFEN